MASLIGKSRFFLQPKLMAKSSTNMEDPDRRSSHSPHKAHEVLGHRDLGVGRRPARVSLSCSKGGFVRTWASQLGERLGTGAVVEELRRLKVGQWDVKHATTLEQIANRQGEMPAFIPMARLCLICDP